MRTVLPSPVLTKITERETEIGTKIKNVQALKDFDSIKDPARECYLKQLRARIEEIRFVKKILSNA